MEPGAVYSVFEVPINGMVAGNHGDAGTGAVLNGIFRESRVGDEIGAVWFVRLHFVYEVQKSGVQVQWCFDIRFCSRGVVEFAFHKENLLFVFRSHVDLVLDALPLQIEVSLHLVGLSPKYLSSEFLEGITR